MSLQRLACTLAMIWVCSAVEAQETPAAQASNQETIHNQLRDFRDQIIEAVHKKDKDAILKLVDENAVLTVQDGEKLVAVRGQAGLADYLDRMLTGKSPGVKEITMNLAVDEKTILYSDSFGIAFGTSTDQYRLGNGSSFTLPTRWTATLVAKEGTWKLAGLQVSSNLFDNPVLHALQSTGYILAAIAGVLGIAMGFVIGKRTGRLAK